MVVVESRGELVYKNDPYKKVQIEKLYILRSEVDLPWSQLSLFQGPLLLSALYKAWLVLHREHMEVVATPALYIRAPL